MAAPRIFEIVALVCFALGCIPYPNAVPWLPLGLAFLTLGLMGV